MGGSGDGGAQEGEGKGMRPNTAEVLARLGLMTAEAEAKLGVVGSMRSTGSGTTSAGAGVGPQGQRVRLSSKADREVSVRAGGRAADGAVGGRRAAGWEAKADTEWARAGDARASNWRDFHKEWQEHKEMKREKRKRKRVVPSGAADGDSPRGARGMRR